MKYYLLIQHGPVSSSLCWSVEKCFLIFLFCFFFLKILIIPKIYLHYLSYWLTKLSDVMTSKNLNKSEIPSKNTLHLRTKSIFYLIQSIVVLRVPRPREGKGPTMTVSDNSVILGRWCVVHMHIRTVQRVWCRHILILTYFAKNVFDEF